MAADIPLRIIIGRLQSTVNQLTSIISSISPQPFSSSYLALRAATTASLGPLSAIIVLSDIQGNAGLFVLDAASVASDDGVNVIIDGNGRRWVRQQAPV